MMLSCEAFDEAFQTIDEQFDLGMIFPLNQVIKHHMMTLYPDYSSCLLPLFYKYSKIGLFYSDILDIITNTDFFALFSDDFVEKPYNDKVSFLNLISQFPFGEILDHQFFEEQFYSLFQIVFSFIDDIFTDDLDERDKELLINILSICLEGYLYLQNYTFSPIFELDKTIFQEKIEILQSIFFEDQGEEDLSEDSFQTEQILHENDEMYWFLP